MLRVTVEIPLYLMSLILLPLLQFYHFELSRLKILVKHLVKSKSRLVWHQVLFDDSKSFRLHFSYVFRAFL